VFQNTKVRHIESNALQLFEVEGHALVRFAKFGPGLSTSKNSTHQQKDFDAQQQLPGMPQATHLVVGYVLDPLETHIERVAVACPYFDGNLWSFDLEMEEVDGTGGVLPLAPDDDGPRPIIRSRMERVELPNAATDA
jgi:hypothetical protein